MIPPDETTHQNQQGSGSVNRQQVHSSLFFPRVRGQKASGSCPLVVHLYNFCFPRHANYPKGTTAIWSQRSLGLCPQKQASCLNGTMSVIRPPGPFRYVTTLCDLSDMVRLFQHESTPMTQVQTPGQRETMVPQRQHVPPHRRFIPENPIVFLINSGRDGIALTDAIKQNFDHLAGRNDSMFMNYTDSSISLYFGVSSASVYLGETRSVLTRF